MTVKVEMFWGNPDRLEIMRLGSDDELYVQNVIAVGDPNPDFRTFDCSYYVWDWIIDLGKMMGWSPMGTIIQSTIETNEPIVSDYEPNTWRDDNFKIFLAEDAIGLANSLEKAMDLLNTIHPNVSESTLISSINLNGIKQLINHISLSQLKNFIIFLRKGKFNFVYDD